MEEDGRLHKAAVIISIIIYLATLLALSATSDVNIFIVFYGMLPLLLYIITFFYYARIDHKMAFVWVLPLLFPAIFLLLWKIEIMPMYESMDGPVVAVLNVIMSYVINIFALLVFGMQKLKDGKDVYRIKKYTDQIELLKSKLDTAHQQLKDTHLELNEAKKELIITKDNVGKTLHGIEDKCKAINFVIGRVYSIKKGATKAIRDEMKIDSEWYNTFSEIKEDFEREDAHKLLTVLHNIYEKLLQMEKAERDVFDVKDRKMKLERDVFGADLILEVLKKNDKDPVEDYHREAKEVCQRLIDFLKEHNIDEIVAEEK